MHASVRHTPILGIASAECSLVATIRSATQALREHNDLVACNTALMFKRCISSTTRSSVSWHLEGIPILHSCVSNILPSRWPDDFGPPLLVFESARHSRLLPSQSNVLVFLQVSTTASSPPKSKPHRPRLPLNQRHLKRHRYEWHTPRHMYGADLPVT